MKLRRGRLNIIEFIDEKIIRKTGIIKEITRPYRLKVEAWALSQAQCRGVNVPLVIDYYEDRDGREVLVLERIQGRTLFNGYFKENANSLFNVGLQMALLHNISASYGWIDAISMTGSFKDWKSFLLTYVQTYGERLSKEKIIKEEHLQEVHNAIDRNELEISGSCLVHRDIKPANIIRDKNEKIWIVDWENAILGDSVYDIALFGARYGHGTLWKSLVSGCGFDVSSLKYALYEVIGLIGLIDFCRKHQINYRGRQNQLCRLIQRLG